MNFTRGYKPTREKVSRGNPFLKSCENCAHFFRDEGDEEELCQLDYVSSYDVIVSDSSTYCLYWIPYFEGRKNEE